MLFVLLLAIAPSYGQQLRRVHWTWRNSFLYVLNNQIYPERKEILFILLILKDSSTFFNKRKNWVKSTTLN